MVVPTWDECCAEAERHVGTGCELESLFTEEELRNNELAIRQLNEEFNTLHRLDAFDISIAAIAGLVGAAVDILLVGIPKKTPAGLKGGPLSNYIRQPPHQDTCGRTVCLLSPTSSAWSRPAAWFRVWSCGYSDRQNDYH